MSRPCLNCGERIVEGTFCSTACEDETLIVMGQAPTWARRAIESFKHVAVRVEWKISRDDDGRPIGSTGFLFLVLKPRLSVRGRIHVRHVNWLTDGGHRFIAHGARLVPGPGDIVECSCSRCIQTPPMSFYLRVAWDALRAGKIVEQNGE